MAACKGNRRHSAGIHVPKTPEASRISSEGSEMSVGLARVGFCERLAL